MKPLLISAAALALLAGTAQAQQGQPPVARAETQMTTQSLATGAGQQGMQQATGIVALVDPGTRTLILNDGRLFQLADTVFPGNIQPGERVRIQFRPGQDARIAYQVMAGATEDFGQPQAAQPMAQGRQQAFQPPPASPFGPQGAAGQGMEQQYQALRANRAAALDQRYGQWRAAQIAALDQAYRNWREQMASRLDQAYVEQRNEQMAALDRLNQSQRQGVVVQPFAAVPTAEGMVLVPQPPVLGVPGGEQAGGTVEAPARFRPGPFATLGQLLTASGAVERIDRERGVLTLANGMSFLVPPGTSLTGVTEGSEVFVAYQAREGAMVATQVEPTRRVEEAGALEGEAAVRTGEAVGTIGPPEAEEPAATGVESAPGVPLPQAEADDSSAETAQ